jgi:hypothetical protein
LAINDDTETVSNDYRAVLLGLSWVFAFFAIEDARLVFQYLFVVTASLQGFLIFLVFTARDPVVRAYWKSVFCRSVHYIATNMGWFLAQTQSFFSILSAF